jgi:hypothetical protein
MAAPTLACDVKILLANSEPSTHGTKLTWRSYRQMSASEGAVDIDRGCEGETLEIFFRLVSCLADSTWNAYKLARLVPCHLASAIPLLAWNGNKVTRSQGDTSSRTVSLLPCHPYRRRCGCCRLDDKLRRSRASYLATLLPVFEWAGYSLFVFASRANRSAFKRCMFWTAAVWRAASCLNASLISASRF